MDGIKEEYIRILWSNATRNNTKYLALQLQIPGTDDMGYIVIPLRGKKNLIQQPGYMDKLLQDIKEAGISIIGTSQGNNLSDAIDWLVTDNNHIN